MATATSIKWDVVALATFTAVAAVAYLAWWAMDYAPWFCYLGGLVVALGLAAWLRWLWSRVALWLTKFFCGAALFDLVMEAWIHPFHPETLPAKLACQLTLFGVYAVYLGILRPLDARRQHASVVTAGSR